MTGQISDAGHGSDEERRFDWAGFWVLMVTLGSVVLFAWMGIKPLFLIGCVALISIVIWQACEPFADAAQWIGANFHLPGSVRGATLDAVASSLPEMFTGLFFVLLAMQGTLESPEALETSGEGFSSSIATCAGSAVYNMVLIPAACALVISYRRKNRPTIDVEDKVIARDGIAFLLCEMVLLGFLFLDQLYWWMGLILLGMYLCYVGLLYLDWRLFQKIKLAYVEHGLNTTPEEIRDSLNLAGSAVGLALVEQVRDELQRREPTPVRDDEEKPEYAGAFFRLVPLPLNGFSVWFIIAGATAVAATACYFLVDLTIEAANYLDVPTFFVAVIIAAAASSVPDTFLSVAAALRGDDSGAVSNAFGSNVFDICVCLSIPLIVNSYLAGWKPISLLQENGEPLPGLYGLRILLWILTVVTLAMMWHNRQLNRGKAIILCLLYVVFIGYAVLGSLTY